MIAVVSRSRSRRERSTTKPASATTSSTLPSSEAWILEEREVDRAPRAAGDRAEAQDGEDQDEHEPYTTYFSSRSRE